jgi:Methyltransferase domain
MRLFERTFRISSGTRILDVGGSPEIWNLASVLPQLTILNLAAALGRGDSGIRRVAGDGRRLPFKDAAFDIVFSNSVIEHVGTRGDQESFASEVARVGRQYWVQTPNRRFPVELHLMLPLIHYLPKRAQQAVAERFTVWQLVAQPSEAQRRFYISHFLNELNLLDSGELRSLFPGARIVKERFAGLAKSLIAVKT